MTNIPTDKTYVEETIVVIRPTTSNHIFNEDHYEKVTDQYDGNGVRTVFLREKTKVIPLQTTA